MRKLSLIIPIGIVVLLVAVAGIVMAKGIERNPGTVLPSGQTVIVLDQSIENSPALIRGVIPNKFVQDEIIVKFKGDKEPFRVLKVQEGKVGEKIKEYSKRADVLYAEPNYIAHTLLIPNDPYYKYQWHLDSPAYGGIQMEQAWDISTGTGVTVAVVDTGIRKGTDLASTCFVPGWDYVNNDVDPTDDNGHGTHVAGTVAQSTNNALGVAGVAFESCLMPVKVLDATGAGTYANVALGIRYAADKGVKVISLSLGGTFDAETLKGAVQYAYQNGVTVVAACGNDNTATCLYPAAYDDYVIAVGATQYDETKAPYSNYGPSLDLVAPGGNTSLDQNNDGYADGVLQQTFTKRGTIITWGYYFFQGTSMAAPHISGVAALLIANKNAATPDEVRTALQETAEDLGDTGRDNTYGWGLVDAFAALQWTAAPVDNPPTVSITSPLNGATVSGNVEITADATDDFGVVRVDFYVGTTLIGTDTESPYSVSWDSATITDGTYTITATVIDTASQTASDSVSVLVDNVNDPPVANAGPDQTVSDTDGNGVESVALDGSGSYDPDGTIVSYEWTEGATVLGTTAIITYDFAVGTHTVTLQVSDAAGLTATDTVTITVTETPVEITVFSDSFEVGEWNGLWTEDSQNDWFRSTQRAVDGSYSAEVDGRASNAKLTSIPINLQGKTNATITFSWYIESGLDLGEYLAFDVSTNGGTIWVEKARLKGNVDPENVWHNVSIDLTGINNLLIQFRGTMSDATEDANVDMVKVTAR